MYVKKDIMFLFRKADSAMPGIGTVCGVWEKDEKHLVVEMTTRHAAATPFVCKPGRRIYVWLHICARGDNGYTPCA